MSGETCCDEKMQRIDGITICRQMTSISQLPDKGNSALSRFPTSAILKHFPLGLKSSNTRCAVPNYKFRSDRRPGMGADCRASSGAGQESSRRSTGGSGHTQAHLVPVHMGPCRPSTLAGTPVTIVAHVRKTRGTSGDNSRERIVRH